MKSGDLVKMKYVLWLKGSKRNFVREPAIVLTRASNAIKILLSNGKIRFDLVHNWEVINEI
jgi:hypothetical protein